MQVDARTDAERAYAKQKIKVAPRRVLSWGTCKWYIGRYIPYIHIYK
jgi:hypothetical protein